jgi:outer membrane biosynthesis protein TonB
VSAVAEVSERRAQAVRWVTCFAIVTAAHGLGALALLSDSSQASDFGVDVPVVMLDLPESLVTSTAPAADLPPGPVEEAESQPTPPQKEETKPPEPEAEVAMPIPQPPKPEPPTEEKHATAPPQARTPPSWVRFPNDVGLSGGTIGLDLHAVQGEFAPECVPSIVG